MADLIKKVKIMQQDGTFTDYIPLGADAINVKTEDGISVENKLNKKPYYYNTVADMKADNSLKVGDMTVTLGYYEANDGGGATYKITDEQSQIDYQEELNNGYYATFILKDYLVPEMLGAKGDGTTDDTTAIQNAINAAYSGKGQLNFMDKTYLVTDSLILYNGLYIEGNNAILKILENKPLFISSVISGLHINNLKLVGANNSEYTNNIGMKLVCFWSKFTNMKITNFYQGIYLDTTGASGTLVENIFDTITFSGCNTSFYGGTIGNNKITDGSLKNIIVNNNDATKEAIVIGSSAGWIIQNVHIYGACNYGLSVQNCFHTIIDNIYCENATNRLLTITVQNTVQISNICGRLRNPNCIGIRLDRTSYHSAVTVANISNVYFSVESGATSSYGITDISTALKLNISNFDVDVAETVTDFVKINATNPTYIAKSYIKERLTDSDNFLKYKTSYVGLGYKRTFSGTSEVTISIPLDNQIYSYSMSRISIKMISRQYWDGSSSINYSCNVVLVDKNGTKTTFKYDESGQSTGFTTAPTFTYDSSTNKLDVTFTPSSDYNGCLFATIL